MASAAVSTFVAYNPPALVATQCGIAYCSAALDNFIISCTSCSKEFNLLSCNLFIKHIKECLCVDIPNQTLEQQTSSNFFFDNAFIPTIKCDNTEDECAEELNFDPLLQIMNVEIKESDESTRFFAEESEKDVENLSDYKDENDLTINKVVHRTMVAELINEYRKHPVLWDANLCKTASPAEKKIHFNQIADIINSNFKTNFTDLEIRKQIRNLRYGYKRVIRTKDTLDRQPTLWYFDNIAFIDGTFADTQAEDRSDQAVLLKEEISERDEPSDSECLTLEPKKKRNKVSYLNERKIIIDIINLYKKHSVLWNPRSPDYRKISKRSAALRGIASFIQRKYKKTVTSKEINNKIERLRSSCRRQRLQAKAGSHVSLWYYDKMSFIWDSNEEGDSCEIPEERAASDYTDDNKASDEGLQSADLNVTETVLNVDKKFDTSGHYFDNLPFLGTTESDTTITQHKERHSSEPRFKEENESQISDDSDEDEKLVKTDDSDKSKPYKGKLTQNKELLTFILEEYKKHTCLWSKENHLDNFLSRKRAYANMAAVINDKFGTTFTKSTLNNEIKNLRYSYARMLRVKKENPHFKTKMWYADMLSFTEVQSQAVDEATKDDSQLCTTFGVGRTKFKTEEQGLAIIDLYKAAPILWDTNHRGYKSSNERRKHLNTIVATLSEKYDYHITVDELKYQIQYLRISYFRALRNEVAYQQGDLSKLALKACFFNRMTFLKPFAKPTTAPLLQVDCELDPSEDYTFLTENNALMMNFIELYQKAECLWNQSHIDMNNTSARSDAYDKIIKMFQQNGFTLSKEQVMSAISFLHATVVSTQKAADAYAMHESDPKPVWFYEHLKFLGNIHQMNKKFCNHCNRYFRTVAAFEKHKLKIGDYPFKCPVCGEGFLSRPKYNYHRILHRVPNKCDQCDFQAHCKQNFKVHMLRHQGITPHECVYCHRRFVTKDGLNRHLRTHTGEKPYVCFICGKNIVSSTNYSLHMKQHRNQRDYKCEICGKEFFTSSCLRDHVSTHSEERKHVCGTCGAAFKRRKTLYQHKALHAEKKKHKCKICGQLFAQYAGVYSHMKSHGVMIGNCEVGQLK